MLPVSTAHAKLRYVT